LSPQLCQSNLQCWDNNPATEDICSADGTCLYFPIVQPDPVPPNPGDCSGLLENAIDETGIYEILINNNKGPTDHTAPLSRGTVVRVDVREPTRIRSILSTPENPNDTADDFVQVLLSDCANAASNRISWGPNLYSPALAVGTYYLAIFGQGYRDVSLDVHFLIPSSCKDPVPAPVHGVLSSTTDGYADDFSGSCGPEGDSGHRGDQVYRFDVPQGATWNLHAVLASDESVAPARYLYIRGGCAGPAAREIACDAETLEISQTGDIYISPAELSVECLPPGSYYLFVDSLDPELYELGEYALQIETEPL
jgi:hypothetical protein